MLSLSNILKCPILLCLKLSKVVNGLSLVLNRFRNKTSLSFGVWSSGRAVLIQYFSTSPTSLGRPLSLSVKSFSSSLIINNFRHFFVINEILFKHSFCYFSDPLSYLGFIKVNKWHCQFYVRTHRKFSR